MIEYVNNHIHTTYSFSPYTPTDAVRIAKACGLSTAGIMDHDTIAGADEFLDAGDKEGIGVTAGFESRVTLKGTPFESVRVNNPDQVGVMYVACHGVPRRSFGVVHDWLAPYRAVRAKRNALMVENLNRITNDPALNIDYERDVVPLSMAKNGGSVTERHILFALALKLLGVAPIGEPLVDHLKTRLMLDIPQKIEQTLMNTNDEYYSYRLLGLLKSAFVARFYVDADGECPPLREFIEVARSIGAISAYSYLGDVTESVTGDKKPQAFEDAYLDELIAFVKEAGFNAVTYMPSRNTKDQLLRLKALCDTHELFQISGEDINTPYQPFKCEKLTDPDFANLIDAAFALIGHEHMENIEPHTGMFAPRTIEATPRLGDRLERFAHAGRRKLL